MATKIVTKNSSTASAAPTASDLVQGELAVNVTDKRLYTENASGAIVELGTSPSTIDINAGTIDGTVIGAASASTGAFTTLSASGEITANGGIASNGGISLSDNDKATFGVGGDLEIYHTGSYSVIRDGGTGALFIGGNDEFAVLNSALTEYKIKAVSDGAVTLYYNNAEKLATTATGIDVTGSVVADSVGIGTSSPNRKVSIWDTVNGYNLELQQRSAYNSGNQSGVVFSAKYHSDGSVTDLASIRGGKENTTDNNYAGKLGFFTRPHGGSDTERMRISSSGGLFLGTTSTTPAFGTGTGMHFAPAGESMISGGNNTTLFLNRTTGDGSIMDFRKNGSQVGTIGTVASRLFIGNDDVFLTFQGASDRIYPASSSGGGRDNAIDLGGEGTRFKDLYLSGSSYIPDVRSTGIQYFTHTTDVRFRTNGGTERMRIDSSGNVLVGKTATNFGAAGCQMAQDGTFNTTIDKANNSGENAVINRETGYGTLVSFRFNNGEKGTISTNGSATAYNTSSDYRLKEDVQAMSGATNRLKELKPVNFAWKEDGSRVDGFLAHEAQAVVPECVTGTKDAMRDEEYEVTAAVYEDVITPAFEAVEGVEAIEAVEAVDAVYDDKGVIVSEAIEAVEAVEGVEAVEAQEATTESVLTTEAVMGTRSVPDMQGIDQSKLVPLLTAALQEAITKIESLTSRIEALEAV